MKRPKPKFSRGDMVWWKRTGMKIMVGQVTKNGFISRGGWVFKNSEVRPLTKKERGDR